MPLPPLLSPLLCMPLTPTTTNNSEAFAWKLNTRCYLYNGVIGGPEAYTNIAADAGQSSSVYSGYSYYKRKMDRACLVSAWSEWSACTALACGVGAQNRTRLVTEQPTLNGAGCDGLLETRYCNSSALEGPSVLHFFCLLISFVCLYYSFVCYLLLPLEVTHPGAFTSDPAATYATCFAASQVNGRIGQDKGSYLSTGYVKIGSSSVQDDAAACGAHCLATVGCKGFDWQTAGAGSSKCTLSLVDAGETPSGTGASSGPAVIACAVSALSSLADCTNYQHYSLQATKVDCALGPWSDANIGTTCATSCEATLSSAAATQTRAVTIGQCGGVACAADVLSERFLPCTAPDSPSAVTASWTAAYTRVQWSALTTAGTGNNAVKKYAVTAYSCPAGASAAADCTAALFAVEVAVTLSNSLSTTSLDITGSAFAQLAQGQTYAFGVTAENDAGASAVTAGSKSAPLLITSSPTSAPTQAPSHAPTMAPTPPTAAPTQAPTQNPTVAPTLPTAAPTAAPSAAPSSAPTPPTAAPTQAPTQNPTVAPTPPTAAPTQAPTQNPTTAPTPPTSAPTQAPTTNGQTYTPSAAPTQAPTHAPTTAPTPSTAAPTQAPTTNAQTQAPTLGATSLVWVAATPSTLFTTETPTSVVFALTTTSNLSAGGTLTLVASTQIWAADHADALCTEGGGHSFASSVVSETGTTLTITNGAVDTNNGGTLVITCSSTMAANGAAGSSVTFSVVSSSDTLTLTGLNGWTIDVDTDPGAGTASSAAARRVGPLALFAAGLVLAALAAGPLAVRAAK